jgi:hypothetical protein
VSRIFLLSSVGLTLALASGCSIGDAQTRLRSAVDEKYNEYNECYAQALVRDENTAGQLDAVLYVDKVTGAISKVEFNPGSVTDPELERCLTAALGAVDVEGDLKRDMQVSYTFELRQVD